MLEQWVGRECESASPSPSAARPPIQHLILAIPLPLGPRDFPRLRREMLWSFSGLTLGSQAPCGGKGAPRVVSDFPCVLSSPQGG